MPYNSTELSRRLNKEFLVMAIPVLLLLLLFTESAWPEDHLSEEIVEMIGVPLLILAILGRIWAILFSETASDGLPIIQGPYRYVGNPLFFFGSAAFGAVGLIVGSFTVAAVIFVFCFLLSKLLMRVAQERAMELYPDETRLYRSMVPDFFPSLVPQVVSDGVVDHLQYTQKTIRNCVVDAAFFACLFPLIEVIDWAHDTGLLVGKIALY